MYYHRITDIGIVTEECFKRIVIAFTPPHQLKIKKLKIFGFSRMRKTRVASFFCYILFCVCSDLNIACHQFCGLVVHQQKIETGFKFKYYICYVLRK